MFSRRDETRWTRRWLDGPAERLSGERRRELMDAAAARGRTLERVVMRLLKPEELTKRGLTDPTHPSKKWVAERSLLQPVQPTRSS